MTRQDSYPQAIYQEAIHYVGSDEATDTDNSGPLYWRESEELRLTIYICQGLGPGQEDDKGIFEATGILTHNRHNMALNSK